MSGYEIIELYKQGLTVKTLVKREINERKINGNPDDKEGSKKYVERIIYEDALRNSKR